jgi:hypothetical protein
LKTKKIIPVLAFIVLSVLMITPVFANGTFYYSDLIAGQDAENPVGELTIYFDDQHTKMYVKYVTTECSMIETHLWVGTALEDVPRGKTGNPKIGLFPCATYDEAGTKQVIFEIDVSSGTYYVLAHAVVDCPCIGIETAWGEGFNAQLFSTRPDIFGARWGYFLEIEV